MTQTASADIRQRTLDEATRLFVERGYHAVSMRIIAEQVGVSKAGLYYHFRDKEDLLLAILIDNLGRIEAIIETARTQFDSPRAQIEYILHEIIARSPEQRALIRLASQEMSQLNDQARRTFTALYHRKFISQIEAIMQDGVTRGRIRPIDTRQATWILLGMMYPFLYPTHETEVGSAGEAIDLMLMIFFEGIAQRQSEQAGGEAPDENAAGANNSG